MYEDSKKAEALAHRLVQKVQNCYDSVGVRGRIADEATFKKITEGYVSVRGEDPNHLYDRTVSYLGSIGWPVREGHLDDGTQGETRTDPREVVIRRGLAPQMKAYVLLHEAGHITLDHVDDFMTHFLFPERQEAEADAVSYIAAGLLGMDVSGSAVGYVAGWSGGDLSITKAAAENALQAAEKLADAVRRVES